MSNTGAFTIRIPLLHFLIFAAISRNLALNSKDFQKYGNQMIKIITDYWDTLREREPLADLKPGYMRNMIPEEAPVNGETFDDIFKDIEKIVVYGNTHWQHPNFYAYFPCACNYQCILADMLSDGLGSVGFTWNSSPSMTELEVCIMDWLAKALGLPDVFLNRRDGSGFGMIQSTASSSASVAITCARGRMIEKIREKEGRMMEDIKSKPDEKEKIGELIGFTYHDPFLMTKLVAYCSDQAHSSVQKGVMLAATRLRLLKSTRGGPHDNYRVTAEVLEEAIKTDRKNGLIPYIFIMTLGSTSSGAVDPVDELAPICQREGIWVHIDSAYAGAFLICPEHRYLAKGLEYVDSFNTNPHKALQVIFDCSAFWLKDARYALRFFTINPLYLKYENQDIANDMMNLELQLGRRFRSLKLWFVLRNMGISGLQMYLRKMIELAKIFEELIKKDDVFELFVPRAWALVCFRIKNSSNESNKLLYKKICDDRRIHLVPSETHGIYYLRLVVCSTLTTEDDIIKAHSIIRELAIGILNKN